MRDGAQNGTRCGGARLDDCPQHGTAHGHEAMECEKVCGYGEIDDLHGVRAGELDGLRFVGAQTADVLHDVLQHGAGVGVCELDDLLHDVGREIDGERGGLRVEKGRFEEGRATC